MTDLTCKQFIDFLDDFVEDRLDAATLAVFKRHLDLCPDCVIYLNTYRDTIRVAREVCREDPQAPPPAEAPEDLIQAILAARPQQSP